MDDVEIKIPKDKETARHSKRHGVLVLILSLLFTTAVVMASIKISEEIARESRKTEEQEIAENVCKNDIESPRISIIGDIEISLNEGDKYEDQGAVATDNCTKNVEVISTNEVKIDQPGEYHIIYSASDETGNESTLYRKVTVKEKEKPKSEVQPTKPATPSTANLKGSKIIYLTFDDGPGPYTAGLLDVLRNYGVKATFFVTCNDNNKYADMIKREYEEGHTVALHTCTHNYSQVYQNEEAYFNDLGTIMEVVKTQTGGYEPKLIRFPGGSSNTVSRKYNKGIMSRLSKVLTEKGYVYFDWNVSSGDAGGAKNSEQVYQNVVKALKADSSVVLQHDIKKFSVDAVERIIQFGLSNGFTFRALDASSPTAHHRINN